MYHVEGIVNYIRVHRHCPHLARKKTKLAVSIKDLFFVVSNRVLNFRTC